MFFVLIAKDKPGSRQVRANTKRLHMAHLDAAAPGVRVLQSGPLLSSDGSESGSLVIIKAQRIEQVEAFVADDPYVKAGLFSERQIIHWSWKRGNPYLGEDADFN